MQLRTGVYNFQADVSKENGGKEHVTINFDRNIDGHAELGLVTAYPGKAPASETIAADRGETGHSEFLLYADGEPTGDMLSFDIDKKGRLRVSQQHLVNDANGTSHYKRVPLSVKITRAENAG